MAVKDRVGREINEGDFVAYVTAGDRHPVFEFGWVLGFQESKSYGEPTGNYRIKIQRAAADGTRETVQAVDVSSHWHPDAPPQVHNRRNPDGTYYYPSSEEYAKYWVEATYRDTGKPSTTTLSLNSPEYNNNRILIVEPF